MVVNAFSMKRPDDPMAMPSPARALPVQNSFVNRTAPAPPPVAPNAMRAAPASAPAKSVNPFAMAPAPKPNLAGNAFKAFASGILGNDRVKAIDAEHNAAGNEKTKQVLSLIQQQRALPMEQRAQWWEQNADGIGQLIGQDVRSMPVDPSQFTDRALDGHAAMLSAQLGIAPEKPPGPDYQFLQGPDGAIARGDKTSGGLEVMQSGVPKAADPVKWDRVTDASGQVWQVDPYTGEKRKVDGLRERVPQDNPSPSQDTYRPATAQDLAAWGIPEGTAVKINNRTGEPQVISGAKPASEYTPSQQSKFIQQAQTLDAVDGALKAYTDLIDSAGPQLWTTGLNGDNPTAKKLDAARTAILIQAKELFNLGVLNGPDLDIISSAVPDVTGFDSLGKSPQSAKAQLGVLSDYISRGRNQIPEELLSRARPNAPPADNAGDEDNAFLDNLFSSFDQIADTPPPGVSPELWAVMEDDEKAEFRQ